MRNRDTARNDTGGGARGGAAGAGPVPAPGLADDVERAHEPVGALQGGPACGMVCLSIPEVPLAARRPCHSRQHRRRPATARQSDSVEFKLTVPDTDQRSALEALGVDPLEAEFRQAVFFDTPDLALDRAGVVVRARRVRGAGDVVVKLRPVVPSDLSKKVRNLPGFGVEVDAMPGKLVCSGTLKSTADNELIKRVMAGTRPLRKLLTPAQKELYAAQAPADIDLDSLIPLGPDHPRQGEVLAAWLPAPDGGRGVVLPERRAHPRALDQVPAGRGRGPCSRPPRRCWRTAA